MLSWPLLSYTRPRKRSTDGRAALYTLESQIPVGFKAAVIFLCLADGRLMMGGFVQDLMSLYLFLFGLLNPAQGINSPDFLNHTWGN